MTTPNTTAPASYLVTITDTGFDKPVEHTFTGIRARLDAAKSLRACSAYPSFVKGSLVRVEGNEVLRTIARDRRTGEVAATYNAFPASIR